MKEKLSRPFDRVVTITLAVVIGIVSSLFIPFPPDAPVWLTYLLSGLHYYVSVLALYFLCRHHLHFPLKKLVTPKPRFNFLRFFSYLFVWSALLSLFALVKYLIHPSDFSLAPDYRFFTPMLVSILLFTPVQTIFEELVFRCSLVHIFSDDLPATHRSQISWSLVSGFLFSLFHIGGPSITFAEGQILSSIKGLLFLFLIGAFAMYLSLRTGSFEPAFAIHMANNLFIDLVLNSASSTQIRNPILLYTTDPSFLMIAEILFCILGTYIFYRFISTREVKNGPSQEIHQNN